MVSFWGNRGAFFTGDKCLEQPDGRTVNIASNKSHPNPLIPGQVLQIADESVSFPLHGPDLAITPTENDLRDTLCPFAVQRSFLGTREHSEP